MSDSITEIRRRLQLATELPEMLDTSNRASTHWRDDVSSLLAEVERLTDLLDRYALRIDAQSRELAELRPENERLRAIITEAGGVIPHDCGPVETCDCVNPPRYESTR